MSSVRAELLRSLPLVRGRGGVTAVAAVVGAVLLVACTDQRPALEPPPAASPGASTSPTPTALPELPPGALRDLVPSPQEVPPGLVPLLQTSGPRDADAVAGFSEDPSAAAAALAAHGFIEAYVAQYASPSDRRTLSVVITRFATPEGAQADLEGDLAVPAGSPVPAEQLGDGSQVRRVPLPGGADELVTVRLRTGAVTALLAWQEPVPAGPAVPIGLARLVLAG